MRTALDPVRVLGTPRHGVCRDRVCRAAIVFRLSDRGKWMPFNAGAAPLHTERDGRGVRYDLMSRDDLHFVTCRGRRTDAASGASA